MTHRREQAGNHSTSISVTDSILRLPTNTLGSFLLLFFNLTRPCSPKGQTLAQLLGKPGPRCRISPAHSSTETLGESAHCQVSLLNFILIQEEVNKIQSKIKKVQKLKVQKLGLLLSRQLSLGFTKRDYSFINVSILRSLGLGEKAQVNKVKSTNTTFKKE